MEPNEEYIEDMHLRFVVTQGQEGWLEVERSNGATVCFNDAQLHDLQEFLGYLYESKTFGSK